MGQNPLYEICSKILNKIYCTSYVKFSKDLLYELCSKILKRSTLRATNFWVNGKYHRDTVKDKNLCTIHRTIVVKLPLLRAVWAGQRSIICFVILIEFFLRSLARSVPIYRHFESNRANWRSSERFTKKII